MPGTHLDRYFANPYDKLLSNTTSSIALLDVQVYEFQQAFRQTEYDKMLSPMVVVTFQPHAWTSPRGIILEEGCHTNDLENQC